MRQVLVALAAIVAALTACGSSGGEDPRAGGGAGPTSSDGSPSTPEVGPSESSASGGSSGGESDGASPAGADAGAKLVVTNESVQVAGKPRTFVLVAPKVVVASKSYPLVFVFHGDGGNGAGQRAGFELERESGDGAIVVYPDGADASWDLYTPEASNEDDAFVDAMLASLESRFAIDTSRIFGSGYSSGAFFINQLACRRTGFFRAIAPNAGGAPQEPEDPAASYWSGDYTKCPNQTGGVAALIMHGSADFVVGQTSGTYDAKYWATVNGCDVVEENRTSTTPPPCLRHASCPPGKAVVYCEIPGLGHTIWSESVKATWAFFAAQ